MVCICRCGWENERRKLARWEFDTLDSDGISTEKLELKLQYETPEEVLDKCKEAKKKYRHLIPAAGEAVWEKMAEYPEDMWMLVDVKWQRKMSEEWMARNCKCLPDQGAGLVFQIRGTEGL